MRCSKKKYLEEIGKRKREPEFVMKSELDLFISSSFIEN